MASSNPMTRDELLESAALDAFGLLDEYESSLYTRSFHHAPSALQREILELQAELVSDETLLSEANPHPALRQRVLDAVTNAIEEDAAELEPLATIGRARPTIDVIGRVNAGYSGQFWRAACFVLCAGLIIALYFWVDARNWGNQVAMIALSNNLDGQLEQMIGPTFKDYVFDPTARQVHLKPMNPGTEMRAAVYMVEDSDKAFLVIEGLPRNEYTLSIKDSQGKRETMQVFASSGRLSGFHIALNRAASQLKNVTWEIANANGVVVMASI